MNAVIFGKYRGEGYRSTEWCQPGALSQATHPVFSCDSKLFLFLGMLSRVAVGRRLEEGLWCGITEVPLCYPPHTSAGTCRRLFWACTLLFCIFSYLLKNSFPCRSWHLSLAARGVRRYSCAFSQNFGSMNDKGSSVGRADGGWQSLPG